MAHVALSQDVWSANRKQRWDKTSQRDRSAMCQGQFVWSAAPYPAAGRWPRSSGLQATVGQASAAAREDHRAGGRSPYPVPAGQDSVAQLQSDSRVFREITNIVSLHPVLSDDPELAVYEPVAHWCASRPARLATYSLQESVGPALPGRRKTATCQER